MPKFSAFTGFSHLRFSSRKSTAEKIYDDMLSNQGGNFSTEFDSRNSGRIYFKALARARALQTLERAGQQYEPLQAVEMLPNLEHECGIVPLPTDSVHDRQIAVSAAMKIARGASTANVVRNPAWSISRPASKGPIRPESE